MTGARPFARDDRPTVTPRIFAPDAKAVVTFMQEVFGAEGEIVGDRPADMRIGDSVVMVSTGGGVRSPTPAALYIYVPDVDATYSKALAAGAVAVDSVENAFFGDRVGTVRDPFGNLWQIATFQHEEGAA